MTYNTLSLKEREAITNVVKPIIGILYCVDWIEWNLNYTL